MSITLQVIEAPETERDQCHRSEVLFPAPVKRTFDLCKQELEMEDQ